MPLPLREYLTIFADASVCSETGAGGWAAWIKRDGAPLYVDGRFRSKVTNSTLAELWALANAVKCAEKLIPAADIVMLQSDCLGALIPLWRIGFKDVPKNDSDIPRASYGGSILPEQRAAIDLIDRLVGDKERQMRHVKGHASGGNGRHAVNRLCDERARRHMREARDELRRLALPVGRPKDQLAEVPALFRCAITEEAPPTRRVKANGGVL